MAAYIWWICVGIAAWSVMMAGAVDAGLIATRQQSISEYLRANPEAFWWPVLAMAAFLCGLAIHVYKLAE